MNEKLMNELSAKLGVKLKVLDPVERMEKTIAKLTARAEKLERSRKGKIESVKQISEADAINEFYKTGGRLD